MDYGSPRKKTEKHQQTKTNPNKKGTTCELKKQSGQNSHNNWIQRRRLGCPSAQIGALPVFLLQFIVFSDPQHDGWETCALALLLKIAEQHEEMSMAIPQKHKYD